MNRRQRKKQQKKLGTYQDTRLEKIGYQAFMKLPKKVREREEQRSLKRIERELKRFEKKKKSSFHSKAFKQAMEKGFKNEQELVQNIQFFERGSTKTLEGQERVFNKIYESLVEGFNRFGYNEDGTKRHLNKQMVETFLQDETFNILKLYGDSNQIMDAFFNAVDKGYSDSEIRDMFELFVADKITFDVLEENIEEGVHFV